MTKHYCDCCGKEIETLANKFNYKVHIKDMVGVALLHGYCDKDMNLCSVKEECVDLCQSCYNEVVLVAYKKYDELKRRHLIDNYKRGE